MLKVFDKVYDKAPFMQDKNTSQHIFNIQIFSLIILSIISLINYSYIFAIKFIAIYTIAGVVVWVYQFFSKSYFFNTSQWHVTVITYILCLSPNTSLINAIFGVGILFILGATILSVDEKPIINPALLGIVSSKFLDTSYYEYSSTPLPYIISEHTNTSTSFIDKLAQITSIISNFTITSIPVKSSFEVLLSSEIIWFGSSSIILLFLLYILLSLTKSIKPLPTIIYIASYTLLAYTMQYNALDSIIWFCGIFLISSNFSLPGNKKGDCLFALCTSVITILLNSRQYIPMNFIFALIITNISSSLIQHLCKSKVFGVKKIPTSPPKITFERPYIFRTIVGIVLVSISYGFAYFLFQTPLTDRQQEYQISFIQKFSDDIIQPSEHPKVFITTKEYIIHQKVSLYRSSVDILAIIQDDKISRIEIANLSHTYGYDFSWLNNLIGTNIKDLSLYFTKHDIVSSNHQNQLITKMFVLGLQQIQDIYLEFLED